MISLDQILVLEQKIESAVAKIAQLTAENDALRSKCAELTNALSAKTEQLSAFQVNQNKIESGIIKALEQLDKISESTEETPQSEFDNLSKQEVAENSYEGATSNDDASVNGESGDSIIVDSANSDESMVDENYEAENSQFFVEDDESDVDFSMEDSEEEPTKTFADTEDSTSSATTMHLNDISSKQASFDEKEVSMIIEMKRKGWSAEEISRVMRKSLNDVSEIIKFVDSQNSDIINSTESAENQDQAETEQPNFDIF